MKAKEYLVLRDAVECGVAIGLARADKHASDPLTVDQRDRISEHVFDHVISAIGERFLFNDDEVQ